MRLTTCAALFFAPALLATAAETTRTLNLSGFSRIDARHAFEVEVRQGPYRVEVVGDSDRIGELDVHTMGDRLVLDVKRDNWRWKDGRMRAVISMPDLRGYDGSGATRATITGFRSTQPLAIDLSGASRVTAEVDAGDTSIELSGASRVQLRGRGGDLRVEGSGASHAELDQFETTGATLRLSGASHSSVNTNGRINVHASGASHVTYAGRPQLGTVDTSGASSIRAR